MKNPLPVPRSGAVAVEFALTAPILFLFVFAAVEFCGINVIRHTAANAAYEGARRGIVPGATAADVQSIATREMEAVGATGSRVTVDPSSITAETRELSVTVEIPVSGNGWITPFFYRRPSITSTCLMVREDYD